ncbi:hypothetical protein FRC07_006570 [Ceratobasidium sp. 392]|nr:hypothetical protein FRC07_006570 [Ceratobasidium sp. 392]
MEPAASRSDNRAVSGGRNQVRNYGLPRRDRPSRQDEKSRHELHPIFDWKAAALPGTQLTYLRRSSDVNDALEQARGPFGFDVESKPTFVKGQAESPVAVLQLAKEDQIYLIQLSAMRDFPERLREVLEDPEIVKAGVGIAGDAKKLWRDYGVSLLGAVELSHLARSADTSRWGTGKSHELISLTRLMEAYQSRRLSKGKVRMSNWELPLTVQQLNYAASDALAGYMIYQHLQSLDPQTLPETYTSDFVAGKKQQPQAKGRPQTSSVDYIQSGVIILVDPSAAGSSTIGSGPGA